MDPTNAGIVTIALCVVLILMEMPVALAICLAGAAGIVLIGCLIAHSGIGTLIYKFVGRITNWLPGGLAVPDQAGAPRA